MNDQARSPIVLIGMIVLGHFFATRAISEEGTVGSCDKRMGRRHMALEDVREYVAERCRERLPALASREGAVRLYRWLDQQEAEVRSAPRRAHPPLPPLMRLHEARVLLVQRANMRDGLDDAQRGREQASRRAARISADLATAEL